MRKKLLGSLLSLTLIMMLAAPATFGQDRRRSRSRLGPKARAIMTAGAGAGIGAGVGALLRGKRGAATGALLGGGGATALWLLKNKNSRRQLGRYGQPIATIASGTAIGAGVGSLVRGKRGAGIGALLGGGGTTLGYLIAKRNRNNNNYYSNGLRNGSNRRYYTRRGSCRRGC